MAEKRILSAMKLKRTFQHQNLTWARRRRGINQAELAKLVGVSTRSIKAYEAAAFAPASDPMLRLAKVLKFPEGFFFVDPVCDFTSEAVSFRAGSKMAAHTRDMALGSAAIAIVFNREVERYFALPEAKLPDYSERDPERAAELLRGRWDLHSQPVGPLLPLLEENGIRIFSLPSDALEADTFSFWYGRKPFILLKTDQPQDSMRADLAKELGYLVLHPSGEPAGKAAHEKAKNFAEAFILPAGAMRKLEDISNVGQLTLTATTFAVPPMMMARRLHHVGYLSERKYRALRTSLELLVRTDDFPNAECGERSTLLPRILSSLYARGVTKHKFAHVLCIYPTDLDDLTYGFAAKNVERSPMEKGRRTALGPNLRVVT